MDFDRAKEYFLFKFSLSIAEVFFDINLMSPIGVAMPFNDIKQEQKPSQSQQNGAENLPKLNPAERRQQLGAPDFPAMNNLNGGFNLKAPEVNEEKIQKLKSKVSDEVALARATNIEYLKSRAKEIKLLTEGCRQVGKELGEFSPENPPSIGKMKELSTRVTKLDNELRHFAEKAGQVDVKGILENRKDLSLLAKSLSRGIVPSQEKLDLTVASLENIECFAKNGLQKETASVRQHVMTVGRSYSDMNIKEWSFTLPSETAKQMQVFASKQWGDLDSEIESIANF